MSQTRTSADYLPLSAEERMHLRERSWETLNAVQETVSDDQAASKDRAVATMRAYDSTMILKLLDEVEVLRNSLHAAVNS